VLALAESAVALIAPHRAPTDSDWQAVAREVRSGFRSGDLIVAAPAWADPVMRMHLGDLVPLAVAGRMDAARFSRVWEISQRGAGAPDARPGTVTRQARHGALALRLVERRGAQVSYDFLAQWDQALVTRVEPARGEIDCPRAGDRFQCPDISWNYVRRQPVEVDTVVRQALLVQPVTSATVVIEFAAVVLGRELTVATGLSNVWMRKYAKGPVDLRVLIDGRSVLQVTTNNDSGWRISRVDTAARAGQTAVVRFEVTSPAPYARHFALAAEARS
jgi:hypothetical protein